MSQAALFAIDLIAVSILVFGLYFPRHRRRDLVVSFLVVNIGVLAVASALSSTDANAGLGLGLFGVLSIIRLRSSELDQQEVAYYFAALALGLLNGISVHPDWMSPVLSAGIIVALFVGDNPNLLGRYRTQEVRLDVAITDEAELVTHLEMLLNATVHNVKVRRVSLVDETTDVEVRYQVKPGEHVLADLPAGHPESLVRG